MVVIKNVECQQNIGKRLFSIHDALIIRRTLVAEFVFSRPLENFGWSQTSYFMSHKLMIPYVQLSLNILVFIVDVKVFLEN